MVAVGRRSGERGKGMRPKAYVMFLAALAVLSADLSAFDGLRKGFILGGGVGAGGLFYREHFGDFENFEFDRFSLATNFKIGYAPSNTLEIYYINYLSWFGYYGSTYYIGVTGLGLTKYLSKEGKGLFLHGGAGLSVFQRLSAGANAETGFGLIGGIGYDIAKHWSIQGDIIYTSMMSGQVTSVGARLTVNILAF